MTRTSPSPAEASDQIREKWRAEIGPALDLLKDSVHSAHIIRLAGQELSASQLAKRSRRDRSVISRQLNKLTHARLVLKSDSKSRYNVKLFSIDWEVLQKALLWEVSLRAETAQERGITHLFNLTGRELEIWDPYASFPEEAMLYTRMPQNTFINWYLQVLFEEIENANLTEHTTVIEAIDEKPPKHITFWMHQGFSIWTKKFQSLYPEFEDLPGGNVEIAEELTGVAEAEGLFTREDQEAADVNFTTYLLKFGHRPIEQLDLRKRFASESERLVDLLKEYREGGKEYQGKSIDEDEFPRNFNEKVWRDRPR